MQKNRKSIANGRQKEQTQQQGKEKNIPNSIGRAYQTAGTVKHGEGTDKEAKDQKEDTQQQEGGEHTQPQGQSSTEGHRADTW